MRIDRRTFLGAAGAGLTLGAPAILRAQQAFARDPFALGIAAGDPSPDGFVIWTRLAPDPLTDHGGMPLRPIAVDWRVAEDEGFRTIVAKGTATARPELGHSVHAEVAGLRPGRPYWYCFDIGSERSPNGMARTLPAAGARLDRLRFAVAGCQNYEDGLYTAYRHMAAEPELDFVFHYGDYIYEARESAIRYNREHVVRPFVRAHIGGELFSLDDYRRRYAQEKLDPDLQAAHARAAWFCTPDDHEVRNNWVGLIGSAGVPSEAFALRRIAALQAYYEHMPLRQSSFPMLAGMRLHRRARIGDLADLHLLDTRQFRSDQPCNDDFKPVCPDVARADAEVLGREQERWLADGLKGGARWNIVGQQVMMMPLDRRTGSEPAPIRNMDSWAGYDAPRERLFDLFRGRGDVVVLTGDEHQNFAGELRRDGGRGEAVAVEFVGTSISSEGDGQDVRPGTDRIMADNPFLKFENDRRGYLLCDVGRNEWRTLFRTVDRVSAPGGVIATRATVSVPRGKPELSIG